MSLYSRGQTHDRIEALPGHRRPACKCGRWPNVPIGRRRIPPPSPAKTLSGTRQPAVLSPRFQIRSPVQTTPEFKYSSRAAEFSDDTTPVATLQQSWAVSGMKDPARSRIRSAKNRTFVSVRLTSRLTQDSPRVVHLTGGFPPTLASARDETGHLLPPRGAMSLPLRVQRGSRPLPRSSPASARAHL